MISGFGLPLATLNKVRVFPSSKVIGPDVLSVICGPTNQGETSKSYCEARFEVTKHFSFFYNNGNIIVKSAKK